MCEMSDMYKLLMAMRLAKRERVGLGLTYFDVIELLGELDSLKSYIAELEAKNERYIKLIQDWVDVLDPRYPQGDGLASAVRQAMLEINKECEE